jgi:hypothetical protein
MSTDPKRMFSPPDRAASDGRRHLRLLLAILVAMICTSPVLASDLRVELDRDRMAVNETLTLRLIAEGKTRGEPDLGPLAEDFEILGRRQSTRMSIVNGAMSHTLEWTLELAPKRSGRLEIPALAWGAARSEPRRIEVIEDAGRAAGETGPKPVFVEAETSRPSPYVQQPFQYRVKVLYRQTPQRALLSEPQVEGATVERDGEDRSYAEFIEGQRYQAIERRFLVVPQKSGPLTIKGPRLEAILPDQRSAGRDPRSDLDEIFRGNPFAGLPGLGSGGRRVVERAPDLEIQVRPQPAGAATPWLPAESVQITEEWHPSAPSFQVGEPVTRTLTVTALGVTSAQLPPLEVGAPAGVQIYPDQARAEDLPGADGPVATKGLDLILVPSRAGPMTLPEVRIPWWDTVADEERVAIVPSRTFDVADGASSGAAAPDAQGQSGDAVPEPRVADPIPFQPRLLEVVAGGGVWPWLAAVLGLGWLVTLILLMRSRSHRVSLKSSVQTPIDEHKDKALRRAYRLVEQAFLAKDPRDARAALLGWADARWPDDPPVGLAALASRLGDPSIVEVLTHLDQAIYADIAGTWDGPAIWRQIEPHLSGVDKGSPPDRKTDLPELYPTPL